MRSNGYHNRLTLNRLKIRRLREDAIVPRYALGPEEDAGMDLHAVENVTLAPHETKLVPTGLSIELPPGFEAQIRPRSGLALKHSITLPNSPATIDPGYRGEIRVILQNLGRETFEIHPGDRIAQMVIAKYEVLEFEDGDVRQTTDRDGGFGSTGHK